MYGGEHRTRPAGEENTLDQLQGMHRQVETDIQENNAEIKLLNNKIVKYSLSHAGMIMIAPSCKNWNLAAMLFSPSARNWNKSCATMSFSRNRSAPRG